MEDRLIEVLGAPTRSPFGYPIPGAGEGLRPSTTLREVPVGSSIEVERVFDSDPPLLSVFEEERIAPGARFAVLACEEARGCGVSKVGQAASRRYSWCKPARTGRPITCPLRSKTGRGPSGVSAARDW